MNRVIIVCATCKYSTDEPLGPGGRTGGETLAGHLIDAAIATGDTVEIKAQKCLWSCTRHCNVLMRDGTRFSYLAGSFQPTRDAADAIIEWFRLHGQSSLGQVAFRDWPVAMKGHFIARIPADDGEAGPTSLSDIGRPEPISSR